jgi:scyllo-inositol 2-dehydrogenase (NADP+)
MSEKIRVGIVGFGLAGQIFHAAVVDETPGMEVACIVERSGKSAAAKYPGAKIVTSVHEMLADQSIQLCVVATPNHTHREIAEACLRAKRHVVVDKPLALTSLDAEVLAAYARENSCILSAFHNRRWDGDFRTLEDLLQRRELGTPFLFESHFDRFRLQPRPGAWRETEAAGGGILFDLGPHLIDQALALFGTPTSIWADVRTTRPDAEVDDTFDIQLTFAQTGQHDVSSVAVPATFRAWLRSTMVASSPGPRFVLHGSEGSYTKWGLDPQEDALKSGARFSDDDFGQEAAAAWGILQKPDGRPKPVPTMRGDYRQYYANVRDAILGKAKIAVGVDAAWSVARLVELARESSTSGQRLPVDLQPASKL